MSLTKVPYTDGVTVIGADNLNNIQDAIIAMEENAYVKPSGGIPETDLDSSAQATLEQVDTNTSDIDDLKSALTDSNTFYRGQVVYSENRYYHDASRLISNSYIKPNGEFATYNGWSITDFIPVEPSTIYVFAYLTNGVYVQSVNNYYALYDENFEFISAPQTTEERNTITTTSDTYYLRISNVSSRFSKYSIVVKQDVFDSGVQHFIPFSIKFINDNTTEQINALNNALNEKVNFIESPLQYDNVVRSIQRIGAYGDAPHHSITGYKDAYKAGFRILLCDLRFTLDNIPVLFHDDYLNQNYHDVYDSNDQLVSTNPPLYIANMTYSQLSEYDYGLYKGEDYRGYPLMTLSDMLTLCKKLGAEIYIEVKAMTEAQAVIACNMVRAYGMTEKTSWAGTKTQMQYVISNIDTARVSTMPSEITSAAISDLVSLKTGKNKVFAFAWDTTILTDEIVSQLIENDIAFEFGTLNSESDILSYFERGTAYNYCTGIESNTIIAGKAILNNALS